MSRLPMHQPSSTHLVPLNTSISVLYRLEDSLELRKAIACFGDVMTALLAHLVSCCTNEASRVKALCFCSRYSIRLPEWLARRCEERAIPFWSRLPTQRCLALDQSTGDQEADICATSNPVLIYRQMLTTKGADRIPSALLIPSLDSSACSCCLITGAAIGSHQPDRV